MTRQRLIFALSLAISAAFLTFSVVRVNLGSVLSVLGQARLWPWLPAAVTCYLCGQLVRGVRLRFLVHDDTRLATLTATNIVVVGYALNNILPARLGEFARAATLTQRTGMPYAQALSVTLIERVLDGLTILGLLALSMALGAPTERWLVSTLQLAIAVFGLASLSILIAALFPTKVVTVASRVSHRLVPRLHDRIVHVAGSVVSAANVLRRPSRMFGLGVLSATVWLVEAGMFLCLLPAFALPARPATALLALSVTNLAILIPSSPGYLGVFHYFCKQAVQLTGAPAATALSYAVLVHASFYVPITIWGVGVLLAYGIRVSRVVALADRARVVPSEATDAVLVGVVAVAAPRNTPPSSFTVAMTEALAPDAAPEESPERHTQLIRETATFVEGEVLALPAGVRLLYETGMAGFRVLSRLRFVRGYCHLNLRARRKWTYAWAFGRFSLGRQLFRLVRSTVLLAYYELQSEEPGK